MDLKVIIEIPAGGSVKYEVNEKTGEIFLDRFLHTGFVYPFNYGSIKDTMGEDGDPLDAMILAQQPIHPGVLVKCHPIGLLEMKDEAGVDTKILAVPDKKIDPEFGTFTSIKDVPQASLDKYKHFWDHMKELEPGKWVKTGDYKDHLEAEKLIKKSLTS